MEPNNTQEKSNGALIGLVIIIIILIIGGIYMWQTSKTTEEIPTEQLSETSAEGQALTSQDAAALDSLDQEAQSTDTSTGVDVNAVN